MGWEVKGATNARHAAKGAKSLTDRPAGGGKEGTEKINSTFRQETYIFFGVLSKNELFLERKINKNGQDRGMVTMISPPLPP